MKPYKAFTSLHCSSDVVICIRDPRTATKAHLQIEALAARLPVPKLQRSYQLAVNLPVLGSMVGRRLLNGIVCTGAREVEVHLVVISRIDRIIILIGVVEELLVVVSIE